MKLRILGILSACLLLFSCSKEEAVKPNEIKHEVKFTVSTFSQEITDISYAKALNTSIGYLDYIVFNSSGAKVNRISQTSADANFGVVSDQLSAGTYTVIIVGSKNPISIGLENSLNGIGVVFSQHVYDSFYRKVTITVGNENIAQNITLDRFVSYVELVLTDAIPANAKKIVLNIENDHQSYFLSSESSSGVIIFNTEKVVETAAIGTTNFTMGTFVLNTKDPLTINIRAYDVDNKIIAEKKVTNVTCVKNRKTILTGKLFEGTTPSSASFTVSVNDTFLEPATIAF